MNKIYQRFLMLAIATMLAGNSFGQNNCESASTQAYTSTTQFGNQIFSGELGLEFTVVNSGGILIKQLGAFDDHGNNGVGIMGTQSGGVRVAVFQRTSHTIVAGLDVIVTGTGDAYTGNHVMKNITPVLLPPGDYALVTKGYYAGEQNGNVGGGGGPYPPGNDGGGAVSFSTESLFGATDATGNSNPFTYPVNTNPGSAHEFLAGTFSFTVQSSCALSNIATLSGLALSTGTLTPSFVQGTMSYSSSVFNNTTSITVTPASTDPGATIKVNNVVVASGTASGAIALANGDNVITVNITAQDGTTTQSYTLTVTRLLTLPVILTNFSANLVSDKKVSITWTTQTETNSANFDVQKSSDGIHWVSVAVVAAAGNSSKPIDYTALDASPAAGTNLYRLRMNDLDGKFAYSLVKNLRVSGIGKVSLYPNPTADLINVSLGLAPQADWSISIVNNSGQVVFQSKYSKSTTTVSVPVSKYPVGNYSLEITDGSSTQTSKFIINH